MMSTKPLSLTVTLWALCTALSQGCETNDPCIRREASCLDVVLTGKKDPVYYKDITIQVKTSVSTEMIRVDELRSTARDAVQGLVTVRLPDSFNALPDEPPAMAIEMIQDPEAKIKKLQELRMTDDRAIQVSVAGKEVSGDATKDVAWKSAEDEDCFSEDQWLMQKYYRVGKNQYQAVYALLRSEPLCKK